MASLKELRNRISSVQATQKITRAMQMVAASKLRRAQEAAEAARPYATHMANVLANLATGFAGREDAPALLAGTGSDARHLLVVATAERGLCGGFNASIARLARDKARALLAEGKQVRILCVGRKGYDVLRRDMAAHMLEPITFQDVRHIGFEQAQQVATQIISDFDADKFDICTLFYAHFESVLSQPPHAAQIIPAHIDADTAPDLAGAVYDYEPEESEILNVLLPQNIAIQILRALLENAASEQGARMSAMDNATRNAGEMIDSLTITYNRSRQAQITKELIEIISGAEAL